MHPERRDGRLVFPEGPRGKNEVDVPGGKAGREIETRRKIQARGILAAERRVGVPEVLDARAGKRASLALGVGVGRAASRENGQPNNIDLQLRFGIRLQNSSLDFGGPPKADASSGVEQQEKAHAVGIAVERLAKLLGAGINLGYGKRTAAGTLPDQQRGQQR